MMYALPLTGKFTKISEMVNDIDPGIKIENVISLNLNYFLKSTKCIGYCSEDETYVRSCYNPGTCKSHYILINCS